MSTESYAAGQANQIPDGQILSALQLASPSLPIGSFAYSQGLEQVIDRGYVQDRDGLKAWCRDMLQFGFQQLDVPILTRLKRAVENEDSKAFLYWNDYLLASRETYELYEEELQLGRSMKRLMASQGWIREAISWPEDLAFLSAYAMAGSVLGMGETMLATSLVWGWLENQMAVACKTIPLGQTDAQHIINDLKPLLVSVTEQGIRLKDDEIAGSLPGQVLFSALHETQYSRLFRS